jgi:hypothetical protein
MRKFPCKNVKQPSSQRAIYSGKWAKLREYVRTCSLVEYLEGTPSSRELVGGKYRVFIGVV